jgi:hypothetical protein
MWSTTRKRRLIQQGFIGIDDATLHDLAPWARIGPAACSLLILLAVWAGRASSFYLLAAIALIGAATGRHPIDFVYNEVIAPIAGTRRLPRCGAPRRFALSIGTLWLVTTGLAFANGPTLLGGILAGLMSAATFMTATLDFCLPCSAFHLLFDAKRKRHVHITDEDAPTMLMATTTASRPAA